MTARELTERRRITSRVLASALLACSLGIGATACSSSDPDTSGATTDLDQVGPDLAKLRLEVQQLREEVRSLREELATVTTTAPPG